MFGIVAQAVLGAAIYSGSHFLKKSDAQEFDSIKLLSTLIIGAVIGLVFALNDPAGLTQQGVETQLIAYAGLVGVTENILKTIGRRLGLISVN